MQRRLLLLAAAVTFLASALPASAAGDLPVDIVTKIYKLSAGKKGDYSGASAFGDKAIRSEYFSKSLLAAIVKMEKKSARTNEPILDFDPVTSSQDPSVKRLKIEAENATADQATIAATFFSFDEKTPSVVRYKFIMEGDSWKLDEMTGGHDKDIWSLRDIIK